MSLCSSCESSLMFLLSCAPFHRQNACASRLDTITGHSHCIGSTSVMCRRWLQTFLSAGPAELTSSFSDLSQNRGATNPIFLTKLDPSSHHHLPSA